MLLTFFLITTIGVFVSYDNMILKEVTPMCKVFLRKAKYCFVMLSNNTDDVL